MPPPPYCEPFKVDEDEEIVEQESVLEYKFGRVLTDKEKDAVIEAIEIEEGLMKEPTLHTYDWNEEDC